MAIRHLTMTGTIIKDAELLTFKTKEGKEFKKCVFTLANSERRLNRATGEIQYCDKFYIVCELNNNRAEKLYPYLKKGITISTIGKLKTYIWKKQINNEEKIFSKMVSIILQISFVNNKTLNNNNDIEDIGNSSPEQLDKFLNA